MNTAGDGLTPMTVQKDYWTPENTGARYPRLAPNSTYGNNNHQSDFWHFDASYCRVKYIQLGYTFDQLGLKKVGISNIRLYVNVQKPIYHCQRKSGRSGKSWSERSLSISENLFSRLKFKLLTYKSIAI